MRGTLLVFLFLSGIATICGATAQEVFDAIRGGHSAELRELTRDPAAVALTDSRGLTPLQYAAAFGTLEAMRVLVERGAAVKAAETFGNTALHFAACDPARARLLVEHGADVKAATAQGRTPLMVAATCASGAGPLRLMIEKGADVNARQKDGTTALLEAALLGGPENARILLDAGAEADVADDSGYTPLMHAAGWNDAGLVGALLKKGARVNAANLRNGRVKHGEIMMRKLTPLMFAAPYGPPQLVRILIQAGADVKMRDSRGMTPLMLAVASDNQDPEVVRLLVASGSDVNAIDTMGDSVLDWALKFNEPEVLSILRRHGATLNAKTAPPGVAGRSGAAPAVARSIAMLQRSSAEFFKQSGCIGCHHQPMMAMAVKAARTAKITLDENDFEEQKKTIALLQPRRSTRNLTGMFLDPTIMTALTLSDLDYGPDSVTDTFAAAVANRQREDGSWQESQTVSRAPTSDSQITRTAQAARVLSVYQFPGREAEFREKIAKARAWLLRARPRTGYERADRLLGLYWTGASKPEIASAAGELLRKQKPDGGWAQRAHLESDAYMTGLALYALYESGQLRARDQAYRKAVTYLTRTQAEDGTWFVRSRAVKFQPYFQSGFPYDHDQWISSTATAYAAIALARSSVR